MPLPLPLLLPGSALPRLALSGLALSVLAVLVLSDSQAEGLNPERLGVVFNNNSTTSARVAQYYVLHRHIPPGNVLGLPLPDRAVIDRRELKQWRDLMLARLPSSIQSLLLIWSRPFAVECMSITTAVAAGYQPGFCEPGCAPTTDNPLFDASGWLPADTTGWLPAMLLPTQDEALAMAVIDRGIEADGTRPPGTLYLVRTQDTVRNIRAAGYSYSRESLSNRVSVRELTTPIDQRPADIIGYFTGVPRVEELPKLTFRPGAAADHLTSTGGVLEGSKQMSALEWLRQGATASYGAVSEPCNDPRKFPNPAVFFNHYLRGDSLLEAYWKSVAMPGQGLFIGEPLARPFRLQ